MRRSRRCSEPAGFRSAAGHRWDAVADCRECGRRKRARDHPQAPDRCIQALWAGRLRQRKASIRGAGDGFDRFDHLPRFAGAELLEPGWTDRCWTLRSRSGLPAWRSFGSRATPPSSADGGCGSRTRARSSPSTGAVQWTSKPRAAPSTRWRLRRRRPALEVHWGRKVMEARPPVRIDKGAGLASLLERHSVANALYGGDDILTWMPSGAEAARG